MSDAPARGSLTRRLVGAAALGAIAVAIVLAVLLRSTESLSDAQEATNRSDRLLIQAARTERLAVDLETGLRGFVITGQRRFLAPYERARGEAPRAATRLRLLADTPDQEARAREIEASLRSYLRDYARPLAAVGQPPGTSAGAIAFAEEGKRRLDVLRMRIGAFERVERVRRGRRSAAADRRADRARIVGYVAFAGLLGLLGLLALLVHRTVVKPVRRVAGAVGRLQAGDLSVRLNQGGPSEIAALGGAIDDLAGSLAESREQLEASAAELRRLSERNLLLLDTVFAQTPAGIAFLDRDLRHLRVNTALAEITGLPVEAHIGRRPEEIAPGMGAEAVAQLERVLATGETIADHLLTGDTGAAPGVERILSTTYFPVREGGEVVGLGVVVVDVTERRRAEIEREAAYEAEREARRVAEEARARAAFLFEAGSLLDSSLDLEPTLEALARLSVPQIADWCSFDLAVAGGRIRNLTVAHTDPEKLELARMLQERYPPDPAATTGVPAVIRSGKPELYPEIPPELLERSARDPQHLELIRSLGMSSAMVVPVGARGRTFGAVTFIAAESGRHFGQDDFLLAQSLANRAGLALDNARLYRERSHVARTLQASLLPEALPVIPGVSLAARYEPLGAATEVGGDFYDVFAVAPDRWAVVIGDVCGKGAEAASLTALARYTLRAVAPLAPADALRRLNAAILRQRNDLRFITLVYAELDLGRERPRLTYASGGHPPGLLLHPEGPGEVLECQGTLIGVTPDPKLTECSVELGAGDTVALYTDGVSEASHAEPLDAAAILATLGGRHSADDVADSLQRLARSGAGAQARDDVAILTLQLA